MSGAAFVPVVLFLDEKPASQPVAYLSQQAHFFVRVRLQAVRVGLYFFATPQGSISFQQSPQVTSQQKQTYAPQSPSR